MYKVISFAATLLIIVLLGIYGFSDTSTEALASSRGWDDVNSATIGGEKHYLFKCENTSVPCEDGDVAVVAESSCSETCQVLVAN